MADDTLVVGSGLAALSFAALMANAGRKVTVLEAHYHPGGFGHTFSLGPYSFNAQLHYVWNCGPDRAVGKVLRHLGLHETVTFEQLDPAGFDRMRIPGYALDIPYDPELLKRRLAGLFPEQAQACAAFVDEVFATAEELDRLPESMSLGAILPRVPGLRRVIRYRKATLQQVFDRFALPQPAQALLGLQWPDFLLPPGQLSFFAWVKLFTGYCNGAYYPTQHFEHVVNSLVGHIEQAGGQVHVQRRVTDFLREGRRIVGVELEPVDEHGVPTGPRSQLRAAQVVCNMDPRRAAERIGLEHFSRPLRRKLDYSYSPSNFMAYCAVKGIDLRDYGFGKNNLFHAEGPDLNEAFAAMYERGDYSRPSFAMTVPSLLTKDRADCPPDCQIVEFLTVADYRRFHELRIGSLPAYRAAKKQILESILDIVERDYVPNFREHLAFKSLGSPTTNEHYCRAPMGNSYGSDMTPGQIGAGRLDHRSSLDGLWFCNASSGYAGFAGTIWTGARLYQELTGDAVL